MLLAINPDKAICSCFFQIVNIEFIVCNSSVWIIDNEEYSCDCIIIWDLCDISSNALACSAWSSSGSYKL